MGTASVGTRLRLQPLRQTLRIFRAAPGSTLAKSPSRAPRHVALIRSSEEAVAEGAGDWCNRDGVGALLGLEP
jgi:hypothetical protein